VSKYKRHALSAIFPDMADDEITALGEDIKANGQQESIWLYKGAILDGWHRYEACMRAGVNPRISDYRGSRPAEFVKSKNWHRRHMNASQRALAVVQLAEWAGAGKPKANPEPGSGLSEAVMAKQADTTDRTIRQAKVVAVNGSAALKDLVKDGEVSVKKAAAVAKLPKREQVAALDAEAEKHGAHGEVDLVKELEHADKQIRALTAQVESLSKSDQAKESKLWQTRFYELEGRLNQCMATKGEAEKQAKYATGELAKIRKMLDVERNGDICRAIMDLKQ
jgi:hypothetical protein